jgi:hypothetical protein
MRSCQIRNSVFHNAYAFTDFLTTPTAILANRGSGRDSSRENGSVAVMPSNFNRSWLPR